MMAESWKAKQMKATEALKALREAGETTRVGQRALIEAEYAVEEAISVDPRPLHKVWRRPELGGVSDAGEG